MKRPLFFACLFFMLLITAGWTYTSGSETVSGGGRPAESYAQSGSTVTLIGTVSVCEARSSYMYLLLRDSVIVDGGQEIPAHTVRVSLADTGVTGDADRTGSLSGPGKTAPAASGYGGGVFPVGVKLRLQGMLGHAQQAANPGQFDAAGYDRIQGISYRLYRAEIISVSGNPSPLQNGVSILRRKLLARLRAVYPEDVQDVLAAMLLGRKELLSEDTRDLYEAGGVSHMLVISSLHLSILGMLFLELFRRLRMPDRTAHVLAGALLFFFIALTGFSTSALRAFLLYVFAAFARRLGRTYDPPTALAFAAAVILIFNPGYLFYSSFQLSFGAAALMLAARGKGRFTAGLILHLGLAPLLAWYFFKLPVFGVAVNLVLVPFLPAILTAGAAGLLFGLPAAIPAVWMVRLYRQILLLAQRFPHINTGVNINTGGDINTGGREILPSGGVWLTGRPSVPHLIIYYVLFAGFLYLLNRFKNRKRKLTALLLVPLMLALIAPRAVRGAQFTFLDTGQGDMICVRGEGGFAMIVDAGSSSVTETGKYRLVPFLESSGISHLTCIAATHMDEDHTNGLTELFSMMREGSTQIRADVLLVPRLPFESENYKSFLRLAEEAGLRIRKVSAGDSFRYGDLRFEVLSPELYEEDSYLSDNEQCMVLSVSYGGFDALLTGDIEGAGEEALLARLREEEKKDPASDTGRKYELLKVAHHGSRNSTSEDFLAVLRPRLAVISCGRNNSYGHPHEELLLRLASCGAEVRRTDLDGAVTVSTDGKNYWVAGYLDSS